MDKVTVGYLKFIGICILMGLVTVLVVKDVVNEQNELRMQLNDIQLGLKALDEMESGSSSGKLKILTNLCKPLESRYFRNGNDEIRIPSEKLKDKCLDLNNKYMHEGEVSI